MTTAVRTDLYPLITAGQSAVRAAETRATPDLLRAVDRALCAFDVNALDNQADRILNGAIRAVSLAEDADEWEALKVAEEAVSTLVHHGPASTVNEEPAVNALVLLAGRCLTASDKTTGVVEVAWERAYWASVEVLSTVMRVVRGEDVTAQHLDKRLTAAFTAVRRAIPYEALYEARRALVEAARAYGLFVIGMRQPMPKDGQWEWARRIGTGVFHFEVEFPHMDGDPYGAVAVRRTAEDGTAGPVRYIPLGPDQERRRAVTEAQFRI
ncbi:MULTISPECIES: hypothetical protein [unclassified Streptomyces]|uniref:hypothetical protein n=1 Tax=unclassified Streptomyces TaxID=2593676 RepID=UPI0035DCEE20